MGGTSHIASFPEALVEPCILASTKPGDFVLDPFFGSGTVGIVARRLRRRYVGIELNPAYVAEAMHALEQPVHLLDGSWTSQGIVAAQSPLASIVERKESPHWGGLWHRS